MWVLQVRGRLQLLCKGDSGEMRSEKYYVGGHAINYISLRDNTAIENMWSLVVDKYFFRIQSSDFIQTDGKAPGYSRLVQWREKIMLACLFSTIVFKIIRYFKL